MNWMAFGAWVVILHCVAFALWLASVVLGKFRCAAPSTTVAMVFFVSVATVVAQKNSPTNEPPRMAPMGGNAGLADPRKDLVPIGGVAMPLRTTGTSAFAASLNKVAKINTRGAWVDSFRLDFPDGFVFPYGTNHLSFVEVFTQGYVRPRRMTYEMLADIGTCGAIVPGLSSIAVEHTPSNSVRIAWEDAAANRNTNNLIIAAIELFRNGNFSVETNGVTTTTARVHPSDVDGDGLPDGVDPNPTVWDGDLFGPRNILPKGANSNAYCYVDLVVHGADAEVVFSGDGPSNLADPHFMARAEETNRVAILIGKGYEVSADEPIECISVSDASIDVCQTGETALYVRWPVTVECATMRSGASFAMSVYPDWLGGAFVWTNKCCAISSSGHVFTYSCNDACHCAGCAATGYYGYEGFMLPVCGGYCGCSSDGEFDGRPAEEDDDGPYAAGASAIFSQSAVIFEDGYWNTPTNWVERQSTTTELHCLAHGGPNGGHVRFEILGEDKLERVFGHVLPVEQDVSPGKKLDFAIVYKGRLPSISAEDIVVTTTFAENAAGATQEVITVELTSVKVELTTVYVAPENPCPHRHMYGVGEKVVFDVSPSVSGSLMQVVKADSGDMATAYDTFDGELSVPVGGTHVYTCPAAGTTPDITISVADAEYFPVMSIVEPQYVVTTNATGIGAFRPGDVVMGTLRTENCIGPMTVSFQGVKVFEVPCSNAVPPVGYFATTNFDGNLMHTAAAGAGVVNRIGQGNYWTVDEAGRDVPYSNWSAGMLVWKVPIGWRRLRYENDSFVHADTYDYECHRDPSSRPLRIGDSEDAYTQVFLISESGNSSVEKFGYRLSRSRWRFSGEVTKTQ